MIPFLLLAVMIITFMPSTAEASTTDYGNALAANSSEVEKVLTCEKEIKSLDLLLTKAKNGVLI